MRNEEAIFELDYVREAANPQAEVKNACGALVQEAYKRGSEDNLTVVLARLQWVDVDPKAAAAAAARKSKDAAAASNKDVPATAEAVKASAPAARPGESAVDALKRKHREAAAERVEADGTAAKSQKVEEDGLMEAVGKD